MGSLRMKEEWEKGREWGEGWKKRGMEEEREGRRGKREFPQFLKTFCEHKKRCLIGNQI